MNELDKLKIDFANSVINLEVAQGRYNESKRILAQELSKMDGLRGGQVGPVSGKGSLEKNQQEISPIQEVKKSI